MTEAEIRFETEEGKVLLLEGVHYNIEMEGLMATTTISQHYSNPYDSNIEAVYTFPMTMDAVLLNLEIKIDDRVLKGTIKEKSEAEAEYEEAIDEGNRAIMVEKSSEGIYTVNIANILPKEKIIVSIEYTQLLEWRGDRVKWSLPTTIAPKYGDPQALSLDDVTEPSVSLLAENLFSFTMKVKGVLADSEINAPSQVININKYEDHILITLAEGKAFMDKDIVFTFTTKKAREERSFALLGKDFDGYAAIASFYPSFGTDLPREPKSITFVIDCSGSMYGVSIDRARTALYKALNFLTEEDSFNIIKFGSDHSVLFDEEMPATPKHIDIAKRMLRSMDADMGGTEMAEALQSAYRGHKSSKEKKGYLFLITDGQTYDHGAIIRRAIKSEIAHYVVGIGYASDNVLLKKLAAKTGGSYESIDPNEKMDDYILALFKKIDTPKAMDIEVTWPAKARVDHSPQMVFDGDTLYAYATFDTMPKGDVILEYRLENGNRYRNSVAIGEEMAETESTLSIVAKLVIAEEITSLSDKRARDQHYRYNRYDPNSKESKQIIVLSTKYQLFSELTNYILVDETAEEEKPVSLPRIQKVDHMMAEMSSSTYASYSMPGPFLSRKMASSYSESRSERRLKSRSIGIVDDIVDSFSSLSVLFGFGASAENPAENIFDHIDKGDYKRLLELLSEWYASHHRLPRRKRELRQAGFDSALVELFTSSDFREEMSELTFMLYLNCEDHGGLDAGFVAFMEKRTSVV